MDVCMRAFNAINVFRRTQLWSINPPDGHTPLCVPHSAERFVRSLALAHAAHSLGTVSPLRSFVVRTPIPRPFDAQPGNSRRRDSPRAGVFQQPPRARAGHARVPYLSL